MIKCDTRRLAVFAITVICYLAAHAVNADTYSQTTKLEEIIVTAQKRTQKMQEIPISMMVLNESDLLSLGVTSLDNLMNNIVPSLKISPNGNTSSSLTIAIRGDGPSDVVQPTRENPVAVYLDGIYLGRTQGLNMELDELERIEVLRGPQGTLFGRNSTSGAVSLITKKPTGEWGFKQTLNAGNYNRIYSVTRVNTPEVAGVKAKFNYLYSDIDGWVENKQKGQADYNESTKKGSSVRLSWAAQSNLAIDYHFDSSEISSTQNYFQLYGGNPGSFAFEKSRKTKTRLPLALTPTIVDIEGHALVANWSVSDNLIVRSYSSYRDLSEDGSLNYGGVLTPPSTGGPLGLILEEDIEQEQYSQEIQLVGNYKNIDWVAGVFYFKEDINYDLSVLISLAPDRSPLIPPVPVPGVTSTNGQSKSLATFGHGIIAISDQIDLTLGARYTKDDKSGARNLIASPDLESEQFDSSVSLSYEWLSSLTTYIKWATAYKAGGYNVRATSFSPYEEETNQTFEVGVKSEWLHQRLRLNLAVFKNETKDKQFDFADPVFPLEVETLNAVKEVDISGIELDIKVIPTDDLVIGLHYVYLDGDMPPQPHPDPQFEGEVENFELIQTPMHSGAVTIDYTFVPSSFGQFSAHVDATSTSRYAHSTVPISSQDSYTLFNAQLTLSQILNNDSGVSLSLWGKNLADEEYANLRFNISSIGSIIQSYGMPRTYGLSATFEF